ncbi:hypothetical protein V8352_06480, partial [Roseovarius sp. D0-M9]
EVHRKQRHTAKRVFERLRHEHGFTGGYTIVKDYMRQAATMNNPIVARDSPDSTGTFGPRRFSRNCAISRPRKNPAKPVPDTSPTVDVDIENSCLNSGTNKPNPIRAGP